MNNKIIIAGPCAAESEHQIRATIAEAKKHDITVIRVSLYKPRTRPGFEGLGKAGIPLLIMVAKAGLIPATEILLPEQAELVISRVLKEVPDASLFLWLGARNQNHFVQKEIGAIVSRYPTVNLMVKNQLWSDEAHWEGIINHIRSGGIKDEQLFLCHRGFAPSDGKYRNPPDFGMAMRIKKKTGLPMLVDPSHIAGFSPENVIAMTKKAFNGNAHVDFDGAIIEVHPNPTAALTDKDQQLRWDQMAKILQIISSKN